MFCSRDGSARCARARHHRPDLRSALGYDSYPRLQPLLESQVLAAMECRGGFRM